MGCSPSRASETNILPAQTPNNTKNTNPTAMISSVESAVNQSIQHKPVPISVLTDSYKASHYLMYPEAELMVAYGEFRNSFNKDPEDNRLVFYGIRYIIENYVAVQWTVKDVEMAGAFYNSHNAGNTSYPFPKDLFLKFVQENNGYFPVKIEALQEGSVINIHTPVYQIFAEKEYSRLVTFLETILTQVWYASTVATLSRRTKDLIEASFADTVDEEFQFLVNSRLHDFGFRGCTCVEQSIIGGCAHLLNFEGSDTMSAAYYAQFYLNAGKPVATSIPATEHSVMTSWPNERLAIENMIDKFGGEGKVFACVMDSYDYSNALNKVLPAVSAAHKKKGGLMVLRPDSGDPVDCILEALAAGERAAGMSLNKKGYKVLNNLSAIQGDGINYNTVKAILEAVRKAGFSAQNVAFGMGGGLLQRVNRDTMSFATKLSYIIYSNGQKREIMKKPKTDSGKISFPGILKVSRTAEGQLTVLPRELDEKVDYASNELKLIYDYGPVPNSWENFDQIKLRVQSQWKATKKDHDVVSPQLKQKIENWIEDFNKNYHKLMNISEENETQQNGNIEAVITAENGNISQ
jgi:nicotinamide phosphoribosyltransferase